MKLEESLEKIMLLINLFKKDYIHIIFLEFLFINVL